MLEGIKVFENDAGIDDRGSIWTTWKKENFNDLDFNHDKFSISFACIILFFIGAPLGAIIRKGGFGLPLVISIVLFLVYHFIGIFSKNLAEDSSISPILASWLSTIIMLPISIYLTNRATRDRSIFNFDNFYSIINNFFNRSNNT